MSAPESVFARIPIDQIERGHNVRIDEVGLDQLVASIRKHGVLQPITVVPSADGKRVECLFGHRRLAAARAAGLEAMPCLCRERGTEATRVLTQLAENRDRKEMSRLEMALSFAELRKLGMSQQAIGDAVGMHQVQVSMHLAVLKYPEVVQAQIHRRRLSLEDALAIPLELAESTDGRTLAAVLRRGGRYVRLWVAQQQRAREAAGLGKLKGRKVTENVTVDGLLMAEVAIAAELAGVKIRQWVERAIRAALDDQAAQSTDAA